MSILFDLPTPFIMGHRGSSAGAPENTLSAFELTAFQGAHAIELDAKLTIDGHVVVIHDQTVDRTTNGHGRVTEMTLAELRELDAGEWFDDVFTNERIPTLDEVFATVGQRLFINVELTNYATPNDDLVPAVVDLVKKHHLQDRVMFSSFFPRNLQRAHRLLPDVPLGLLVLTGWMGWIGRMFSFRDPIYSALHPYHLDASSALVRRVHRADKRVHAWTVNGEDDIRRMKSVGVDGIMTDNPALAMKVLGGAR
jgi:glycerophosphoryl diester phosphodiesterase